MLQALGHPAFYIVFWTASGLYADWRWRQHLRNQREMIELLCYACTEDDDLVGPVQ